MRTSRRFLFLILTSSLVFMFVSQDSLAFGIGRSMRRDKRIAIVRNAGSVTLPTLLASMDPVVIDPDFNVAPVTIFIENTASEATGALTLNLVQTCNSPKKFELTGDACTGNLLASSATCAITIDMNISPCLSDSATLQFYEGPTLKYSLNIFYSEIVMCTGGGGGGFITPMGGCGAGGGGPIIIDDGL